MKKKRAEAIITDSIIVMAGTFFVWVAVLLLWKADADYPCRKDFSLYNGWAAVLLGVCFLLGLLAKRKGTGTRIAAFCDKHIGLLWGIVFAAQIYIFWNIYFETDWDVYHLIHVDLSEFYYQRYPNNLFLAWLMQNILRLNDAVGINFGEYRLMPLVILNCGISSLVGRLVHFIVKKHYGIRWAMAGGVLYFLLAAISPWNVIPYSDSVGLLFPALIYALYISDTHKILKGAGIPVLSYIGYLIKPQCIILFLAIAIVEIGRIGGWQKLRENLPAVGVACAIAILAVLSLSLFLKTQYKNAGYVEWKDAQYGAAHYLMMGLNEERNGIYSTEDVEFSAHQPSKEVRTRENIRVSVERVKNMGAVGLARHLSKKLLIAFNDGTFAWGCEGIFYSELKEDLNTGVSPWLKDVYYHNSGRLHFIYGFIVQQIWILLLLGITVCLPLVRSAAHRKKEISVVILALLGLGLFELLFEVRARYLYTYVPLFVIAFLMGLHALLDRAAKRFSPDSK